MNDMADTGTTAMRVPVGAEFELLVSGILAELDAPRLRYVRRRADALLNGEAESQAPVDDEREAERWVAAERSRRARLQFESPEAKEEIRRGFREFMRQAGIEEREPIGAVQLRQMLLAEGIRPEDNEFSRAIIAMREE